jgi:ribosomal protein S18 acetylase RimI-like enzyme
LFHKVIEPLYGDQSSALLKIAKAEDRTCEVLLADDTILGIVVYKNFPISEFADNSLEIKTLFVVDAENNSHKGIGSKLVQRVEEVAKMRGIFENIVVTVSEEKPQSIEFFKRKGFEVIKICPDKYKKGMKEYVFCKSLKNKE